MTLHLNLPGSHTRSNDQQQELREARRILKECIRTDWEYPTLPEWKSSGRREPATADAESEDGDRVAGFRFHIPKNHERTGSGSNEHGASVGKSLGLDFDPAGWREREYSDMDGSEDEQDSPATLPDTPKSKKSDYKFEGPDSVGAQLADRRLARKRKREKALQEELQWNGGLAHWARRRDVWCSARTRTEVRLSKHGAEQVSDSASMTDSSTSGRTSTSSTRDETVAALTPGSTPSVSPDMTERTDHTSTGSPPIASTTDLLIPMAPPFLPDHPIRRRINHRMYPEIYSKVIVQSRTPSVPINLLTLINALVQGWKDDGEWPPTTAPLEKSIGRKKSAREGSFKDGVKAVGRVLRLTGTSEPSAAQKGKGES